MRVRALLAAEAIKAFNRVAFWVLLLFFAGLFFLVCASSLYNQVRRGAEAFRLPDAWPAIVNAATLLSFFSVLCTVVLLVASEWTWRTGRQNVIDGLSRAQFFAAKVLLVGMVAAVYWGTAVVTGGVLAMIGTAAAPGGGGVLGALDAQMLGGLFLYLVLLGAMALLFGMAATGSGPAFALTFLFFGAQAVLGQVMRQRGGSWAAAADYLPTSVLLTLPDPLTYDPSALRALVREAGPTAQAVLERTSAGEAVLLGLAYTAAFLALAWLLYRRRPL